MNAAQTTGLQAIETPALLLELPVLERNIERMSRRMQELGVPLRPHLKTAKSIEVVRRAIQGHPGGVTVSTLGEAEQCLKAGIRDIVYAVGIAPGKLARVVQLIRAGADLTVILDSLEAARMVAHAAADANQVIPVLIELDVDGHRSGVPPEAPLLLAIAGELTNNPFTRLRGVLTHAGESYNCRSPEQLREAATQERLSTLSAVRKLEEGGFPVGVVSVGSTPTATFATAADGVTEIRAGVYMFQDLVMAGLGVCTLADIAVSVLVSVIGHQAHAGRLITDGGWTALSRDRGTASQAIDQGYGLVCDLAGRPLAEDVIVEATNQEHGILARRNKEPLDLARYPIGTRLRILPNHACATAAQYAAYQVLSSDPVQVVGQWPRFSGW